MMALSLRNDETRACEMCGGILDSEKENMVCVGAGDLDDEWIRWFRTGTQTGETCRDMKE